MDIEDLKSLKNGDILALPVKNSHNNFVHIYRVLSSEKRNIGWVISTILMYKIDSGRRIFINKKLGYGLFDPEMRNAFKKSDGFLKEEIRAVFNGS